MNTITTTLVTTATFSDDGKKRYLLSKQWDESKPKLAVIMLAPSIAAGIELDASSQLCLNNSCRLGYGSISITNLFATLNDFELKQAEVEDPENIDVIVQAASAADCIVYAAGVGKAKNKTFQKRQEQVLKALLPYEEKLHCLYSVNGGGRLQHPLSPAVRTWALSPLRVSEVIGEPPKVDAEPEQKKRGRGRPAKTVTAE